MYSVVKILANRMILERNGRKRNYIMCFVYFGIQIHLDIKCFYCSKNSSLI